MDPQALLAQLEPLREPPAIGWWPLAPGWWLLAAAVLAALLYAVAWSRQKWLSNRYRRLACAELTRWRDQHQRVTLEQLNQLLKVTALQAWPSADVASLHGAEWVTFLSDTAHRQNNADFSPLLEAYKSPTELATEPLIDSSLQWIKRHNVSAQPKMNPDQALEGQHSHA
ncbi:MAG: DUF4381 domain-containing protein [Halieaceae bacterium]